jgi:outer membrane protein OmpA-like peptidoglycan-associated protein
MRTAKKMTLTILIAVIMPFVYCSISLSQEELMNASIKNIGAPVNTTDDEFFPSITADGLTMVFNSRPKGKTNSDSYMTTFRDGQWSEPAPINELNSPENDETPFISADGSMIIFASNRKGSLKPPVTNHNYQFLTEDLYVSYREKGAWTSPRPIAGDVNTIENERAPSLSSDGKTLYFSRWPLDSIEESRIMMATLIDGEYKNIAEMPYPINSSYSAYGFMISRTRPGFYFSSNRRGGFGLWDLYFAHVDGEKVMDVINLGTTINTADNELSLTELGEKILFCSNRKGGMGNFDIYEIVVPRKIIELSRTGFFIRTILKDGGDPISIPLSIEYIGGEASGEAQAVEITTSNAGEASVDLPAGFKGIRVKTITTAVQYRLQEFFSVPGKMTDVTMELLAPVKPKAAPVAFQKVFFKLGSSSIDLEYIPVLHDLIAYLRKNPSARLRIVGYADRRGEHYRNIELSMERSMAVRDYLLTLGIDNGRLEIKGKGYRFPVFDSYGIESDNAAVLNLS